MQFTLRHFFLLVLLSALLLASMRLGGAIADLTLIFAGTILVSQLIIALVARRERRAFAVGFSVAVFAYALPHATMGLDSLDPNNENALPTTRSFQPLHRNLSSRSWVDNDSKEVVPDDDPRVLYLKKNDEKTSVRTSAGTVTMLETPSRVSFALLAHTAIALTLGVIGGCYALRVYRNEKTG